VLLWLPILALAATPTERLDAVVDDVAARLEGREVDRPAYEVPGEVAALCELGMEMACRMRVAEHGWDYVVAYADSPCLPSHPCPAEPLVLLGERDLSDAAPASGAVPLVEEEGLVWFLSATGSAATCARDGTVHVYRRGRYRFTGVRCGVHRWGPDGDILWVHTRGSLVAIEPISGATRRWIVAGLDATPSVPLIAEDQQLWLQRPRRAGCGNGLGATPTWRVEPVPRIPASSAGELSGLWRSGRKWLWIAPDVGRRAVRHGPLVVVDGRQLVLRGDRLQVGTATFERVVLDPVPTELVGSVGPVEASLLDLPALLPLLPRRASLRVWGDGPPEWTSASPAADRCASGPCEVFSVGFRRDMDLRIGGKLRHYPDGRWTFSGRSCANETSGPARCRPVELHWQQ